MRLDVNTMFSDAQPLSGTSVDSKTLDIGKAGFSETTCYIVVRFPKAVAGLKSVALKGCAEKSGTYSMLVGADVKDLTAGGGVNLPVPQGCPRFLKLVYEGSTSMSGSVTAGVTLQAPSPRGARIGDMAAR